jgi:hypothetical protein
VTVVNWTLWLFSSIIVIINVVFVKIKYLMTELDNEEKLTCDIT